MLPQLGMVDWVMAAVLALSVLVGLWRGLVFELMSLVGWVVAYVAAQMFSGQVAAYVPVGAPGSALHQGAAYAATFIGALLAWALLSRLVRMIIRATPLTLIDRFAGALFGVLRGGVLLVAAATLVAFTPAARSAAWQESQGAAWLTLAVRTLKPMLPPDVARHLPG